MGKWIEQVEDQRLAMIASWAAQLQRNRMQIEHLKEENERLSRLMEGSPPVTWRTEDGIEYTAVPMRPRQTFKITDIDVFRKAVKDHDYWCTKVPDTTRIRRAIEVGQEFHDELRDRALVQWEKWAEFKTLAPSVRISKAGEEEGEKE